MFITNAFSLQMLDLSEKSLISVTPVSVEEIKERLAKGSVLESALGHADIARVTGNILGIELPVNRISNKLKTGEPILVAQFVGGRLPEGATSLPEGFEIKFVLVAKVEL